MRIEDEVKLDYSDVLIRPKRSTLGSRKEVRMERKFDFVNYANEENAEYHYEGIPIMASNMDGVGTFEMADRLAEFNVFTCLVKTYSVNELVDYFDNTQTFRTQNVAMSIGIKDDDQQKFRNVYEQVGDQLKYVCIDVANGYSQRFIEYVKEFRQQYPNIVIIAGNVVTADQTQELILNGADIVKVGIGPGSVCTTRIQTGVGYPQLSAVIECADAAHGLGGHIIADGGCVVPGDIAKAFGAGSDFVMLGGMFAGHDECEGEKVLINGEQKMKFRGMSSEDAQIAHYGSKQDYRASEGRVVYVPCKGPVCNTVNEFLGGLRSAMTYAGAIRIKDMPKCVSFIRVNRQLNNPWN